MLPMLKCHTNYGFHELFLFQRKNLTDFFERQGSMEKCSSE